MSQFNKIAKRELKDSMRNCEEVQVRLINYKKDGEKFLNVLTTIPIAWAEGGERRYVVGFLAEEILS